MFWNNCFSQHPNEKKYNENPYGNVSPGQNSFSNQYQNYNEPTNSESYFVPPDPNKPFPYPPGFKPQPEIPPNPNPVFKANNHHHQSSPSYNNAYISLNENEPYEYSSDNYPQPEIPKNPYKSNNIYSYPSQQQQQHFPPPYNNAYVSLDDNEPFIYPNNNHIKQEVQSNSYKKNQIFSNQPNPSYNAFNSPSYNFRTKKSFQSPNHRHHHNHSAKESPFYSSNDYSSSSFSSSSQSPNPRASLKKSHHNSSSSRSRSSRSPSPSSRYRSRGICNIDRLAYLSIIIIAFFLLVIIAI